MKIEVKKRKKECTLVDCPPGLFLFDGALGFKTPYPIDLRQKDYSHYYPQAFVVATGEVFWGGVHTHEERCRLMVQPLSLKEEALAH